MKELAEIYQPVETTFREELLAYVANGKYVSIQYFSDIREYLSTRAVLKEIYFRDNADYLLLSSGIEIRLDRIVRVEGNPAPGFQDYFACEC